MILCYSNINRYKSFYMTLSVNLKNFDFFQKNIVMLKKKNLSNNEFYIHDKYLLNINA